jgi:hypothetical protein
MLGAFATQSKRDNFLQLAATVFDHSRDASPRKQATPENTSRPGQAPERIQGRASPVKIEFTVDAFMAGTVYEAMSREDFCDVVLTALSPSVEGRLPESHHFAESDVILGGARVRSVHKAGYGHNCDWAAA